MIRLPPKRQKIRSGIRRTSERRFPRHEKWVRGHSCSIKDCNNGPVEFAHIRSAANSGMGLRPADFFGIFLCAAHHAQQHSIGQQRGGPPPARLRAAASMARQINGMDNLGCNSACICCYGDRYRERLFIANIYAGDVTFYYLGCRWYVDYFKRNARLSIAMMPVEKGEPE